MDNFHHSDQGSEDDARPEFKTGLFLPTEADISDLLSLSESDEEKSTFNTAVIVPTTGVDMHSPCEEHDSCTSMSTTEDYVSSNSNGEMPAPQDLQDYPKLLDSIATATGKERLDKKAGGFSNGSSPDPYRAMAEMSLHRYDEPSIDVSATDPSNESPKDRGWCSRAGGSRGRSAERESDQLRAMLADSTENNSRQIMELEARKMELQKMKMELKKAKEKNTVDEGYIEKAEEEHWRLVKDKESLSRKLKQCTSELDQLRQELKHRDEIQQSLEKAGGSMNLRARAMEGFEKESGSSESENNNPKAPGGQLTQMILQQVMNMVKDTEDRCRSVRLQNARNLSMDQGKCRPVIRSQFDEHQMMMDISDFSSGGPLSLDSLSGDDPKTIIAKPRTHYTSQSPDDAGRHIPQYLRSPESNWLQQYRGSQAGAQSDEHFSRPGDNSFNFQQIVPKLSYSPTMDWTKTETQWLTTPDSEAGSSEGSTIAMRVHKRRRTQKSIEGPGADEAKKNFINNDLGITFKNLNSESRSTATVCSDAPSQAHEGQVDPRGAISDTGASLLEEQGQTPKARSQIGSLLETSKWTLPRPTSMISKSTQTDPTYVWEPENGTFPPRVAATRHRSSGRDKTRKSAGVSKIQRRHSEGARSISSLLKAVKTQSPSDNCHQLTLTFRKSCQKMSGLCVAALVLLGFLLYCCWPSEARAWMKANRIPYHVLLELRNSQVSESKWMQKLNYGLITLLDIDRVVLG